MSFFLSYVVIIVSLVFRKDVLIVLQCSSFFRGVFHFILTTFSMQFSGSRR